MTTAALHPNTHFPAPGQATAPAPPEYRGTPRDGVRLLVARSPVDVRHRVFRDLPDELEAGDLVVVNTSATIAAEADAISTSHGAVVVHVATHLDDGTLGRRAAHRTRCLAADPRRASRRDGRLDGATLTPAGAVPAARVPPRPASATGSGGRRRQPTCRHTLGRAGRPIAYGYLDRRYPLGRLPDGLRHRPGQRRDAVGGPALHRRPGDAAGREAASPSARSPCTPASARRTPAKRRRPSATASRRPPPRPSTRPRRAEAG